MGRLPGPEKRVPLDPTMHSLDGFRAVLANLLSVIEANWTDDDLVERLIAGGVPREAIVLGWVQPGIPTEV